MSSYIQQIAVLALPILFAITLHEAAHGWVAKQLGDRTAEMLGRVSLNPLKHIDLLGTVIVPLLMFFTTGFIFGWAKPVPVSYRNLNNPRRDMALVALAGPGANLLMALIWALAIQAGLLLLSDFEWFALPLILMGAAGVFINALLMMLNLLPILPLDGGRVLNALLPPRVSAQFERLEALGLLIVVVLMVTGMLQYVLIPMISLVIEILPSTNVVCEIYKIC